MQLPNWDSWFMWFCNSTVFVAAPVLSAYTHCAGTLHILPPKGQQVPSSKPMLKSKAPSIKRHLQPWGSMSPYFCKERLVRGHPQSCIVVRGQPESDPQLKVNNTQNNIYPSKLKHWTPIGVQTKLLLPRDKVLLYRVQVAPLSNPLTY